MLESKRFPDSADSKICPLPRNMTWHMAYDLARYVCGWSFQSMCKRDMRALTVLPRSVIFHKEFAKKLGGLVHWPPPFLWESQSNYVSGMQTIHKVTQLWWMEDYPLLSVCPSQFDIRIEHLLTGGSRRYIRHRKRTANYHNASWRIWRVEHYYFINSFYLFLI